MKLFRKTLLAAGIIIILLIAISLTSCGRGYITGYVLSEKDGKIILTSDKLQKSVASGKLIYAEGDTQDKDNIYLLSIDKGLQLTNISLPSGKTNTIQIDNENVEDTLVLRYPTDGGTWIVLPSRSMALLISKDGKLLFNTKQFLPDHEVPFCDCGGVDPIKTTGKYDWVELMGKDDVMFIAVDMAGKVKYQLRVDKPEGVDIRWALLGKNILVAMGSGNGNVWQYYIYSPDGKLIWSTDNIKDYIGGLWMPAGAGSPEYAIYGDNMATLYEDKGENIHLLIVNSKGKTIFDKKVPIEGGRKSLSMLQWIDENRITMTDGQISVFIVNIAKDSIKKVYALSPGNIAIMKNLMVVDGYFKQKHHFLIINTQTGTVSDLSYLIKKEAGEGSYIYRMVPLSQNFTLLWVKNNDEFDTLYTLKDDGKLFLLSVEGDTIYNFRAIPRDNYRYADVYMVTTYGTKNPNTFFLYHIDDKGLPHPVAKNIPSSIELSTYPTIVWHYTTDNEEVYESINHQIVVKKNAIVVKKGQNLPAIVPYISGRGDQRVIFVITPRGVSKYDLPSNPAPYIPYIQQNTNITELFINYTDTQDKLNGNIATNKAIFFFIGKE